MKTREQIHIRVDLKALHMRTVSAIGLVLVEEVLDMIKKMGNMVITE